MINLATFVCFMLPIAIYIDRENSKNFILVSLGCIFVSILAPPFGLYRPHPYSDWEGNKPFRVRRE